MTVIDLVSVIVVLVCGFAGACVGRWLGLPAGVLAGTIVGVGGTVVVLGEPPVVLSAEVKQLLQVPAGLIVGLRISRASLRAGGQAIVPALVLTAVLIGAGLLSALLTVALLPVDPATALFAAAPGGITEIVTVATGLGADGAAVTAVHLVRVLATIALVNVLLARHQRKNGASEERPEDTYSAGHGSGWAWAAMLAGVVCGLGGLTLPVPAGGVIGSVLGSSAVRLWRVADAPLDGISVGVQALSGVVIGLSITGEFFGRLLDLGGAVVIIVTVQAMVWLAASYLLARLVSYERVIAVFAAAPGGMSDVISAAGSAGANTTVVAFTHLVRLSAVILVVPALVAVLLSP